MSNCIPVIFIDNTESASFRISVFSYNTESASFIYIFSRVDCVVVDREEFFVAW